MGSPVLWRWPTMKNFARLVRFAWPYRVRFGLSLACAAMVALSWGANIGMVYPLLQILIRSENCQSWVEDKVDATRTEALAHQARLDELKLMSDPGLELKAKLDRLDRGLADYTKLNGEVLLLRRQQLQLNDEVKLFENVGQRKKPGGAAEQALLVAQARYDELKGDLPWAKAELYDKLAARGRRLTRDRDEASLWNARYRWVQPYVARYLPHSGFRTLVLVLGLVMVGIAMKGFFLFLQEVLVVGPRPSSPSSTSGTCSSAGRWRWTWPASTTRGRPSCWPGSPTTWTRSTRGS